MLVEVKVERLTLDRSTQSPVVVLREEAGERALPIWIGAGEASAIHMQLAHMSVGRPLTHDLLASAIRELGATLDRVVISKVEQNTYYARLELSVNGEQVTLDARPSDSIAVALRTRSPIYADDGLLDIVRIEMAEGEDETLSPSSFYEGLPKTSKPGSSPKSGTAPGTGGDTSRGEGLEAGELEDYLRRLNPEDFGRFNP